MDKEPKSLGVPNSGENFDARFRPEIRLDLAQLGYETIAEYAADLLEGSTTVLHNHPELLRAIMKVTKLFETSFADFNPTSLSEAVSELGTAYAAAEESLSTYPRIDIKVFLEQYQLFAGRLA